MALRVFRKTSDGFAECFMTEPINIVMDGEDWRTIDYLREVKNDLYAIGYETFQLAAATYCDKLLYFFRKPRAMKAEAEFGGLGGFCNLPERMQLPGLFNIMEPFLRNDIWYD